MKRRELLRNEIRNTVTTIMNKYRVTGHIAWDKAIDAACEELQDMKHKPNAQARKLLEKSEWQETKKFLARIKAGIVK